MRDDFTQKTKNLLADRVGWKCSNPQCRKATRAAGKDETEIINIGVAAHICAASEGGPRYDTTMSEEERKSIGNGLWLCQSCSKLIDSDVLRYPVETLQKWKQESEQMAVAELEGNISFDKKYKFTIKIKSFSENDFIDENEKVIDLENYFEGRFLKVDYTWDNVLNDIKDYLGSIVKERRYYVKLVTTFSIAFMAGRIMNPKSGIEAIPIQNTINGSEIWNISSHKSINYEKLLTRKEVVSDEFCDIALIISITRNIEEDVMEYINEEKLSVGSIYYCSFEVTGIDSIIDGNHAWEISKQINNLIEGRPIENKRGILHIFVASPVSIIFSLGKMSLSYGKGLIYEYNFENSRPGSYFPAISFSEGDWLRC